MTAIALMTPRRPSNPLVSLIVLAVVACAMAFALRARASTGPVAATVGVAADYVPLRGEAPHAVLVAATRTPRVMDWVLLTAAIQGRIGAGNTTCLTAWWMVDAQAAWKEGERFCGPPFGKDDVGFRRQYQFFNPGEYDVFVSLRTMSGREFDQKHVHLVVQPKAEE